MSWKPSARVPRTRSESVTLAWRARITRRRPRASAAQSAKLERLRPAGADRCRPLAALRHRVSPSTVDNALRSVLRRVAKPARTSSNMRTLDPRTATGGGRRTSCTSALSTFGPRHEHRRRDAARRPARRRSRRPSRRRHRTAASPTPDASRSPTSRCTITSMRSIIGARLPARAPRRASRRCTAGSTPSPTGPTPRAARAQSASIASAEHDLGDVAADHLSEHGQRDAGRARRPVTRAPAVDELRPSASRHRGRPRRRGRRARPRPGARCGARCSGRRGSAGRAPCSGARRARRAARAARSGSRRTHTAALARVDRGDHLGFHATRGGQRPAPTTGT